MLFRSDIAALRTTLRLLGEGKAVLMFPEGTRSRTGELGKFRSGSFALALRTGVPLVPISLEGSYRVIMPKTLQVNPGTIIRIKIDRPIDLSSSESPRFTGAAIVALASDPRSMERALRPLLAYCALMLASAQLMRPKQFAFFSQMRKG